MNIMSEISKRSDESDDVNDVNDEDLQQIPLEQHAMSVAASGLPIDANQDIAQQAESIDLPIDETINSAVDSVIVNQV